VGEFGFRIGAFLEAAEWGALEVFVVHRHVFDYEDWEHPKGKLADCPLDFLCPAAVIAHICCCRAYYHTCNTSSFLPMSVLSQIYGGLSAGNVVGMVADKLLIVDFVRFRFRFQIFIISHYLQTYLYFTITHYLQKIH